MKRYFIIIILPAALWFVQGCSSGEAKKASSEAPAKETTMEVCHPALMDASQDVGLPGELKPYYITQLYPKVKGFVKKLFVDRGSHVQAGQILIIIEAPELEAELQQAIANVADFKARQAADDATYKRLLQAAKTKGAVATVDLETSAAKLDADKAAVQSAEAIVKAKEQLNSYLTVKAPFSGVISQRNISVGDLVGPDETSGKNAMLVLQQEDVLRLTVNIPEVYAKSLAKNAETNFTVSSLPGRIFKAKLSRNSFALEQQTRSLVTEFDVPNSNEVLLPGMYAQVMLPVVRNEKSLFVPTSAVVSSTQKVFVIADENGKAKWIPVNRGMQTDSLTEVFGNIQQQTVLIKNASEEIRDGASINTQ